MEKQLKKENLPWEELNRFGLTEEKLEKTGSLEKLLNLEKTNVIPIHFSIGDASFKGDARVYFNIKDDKVKVNFMFVKRQPQLNHPIYGNSYLTELQKQNLLDTGNAGELVDVKIGDELKKMYVSIDKETNHIVCTPESKIRIPNKIAGLELSSEQKKDLTAGKPVYLEGMTKKDGQSFNSWAQVNAFQKNVSFIKAPKGMETPNVAEHSTEQNLQQQQQKKKGKNKKSQTL